MTAKKNEVRITLPVELRDAEMQIVMATIDHFKGNKTHAADALGVSRRTIYNLLAAAGKQLLADAEEDL